MVLLAVVVGACSDSDDEDASRPPDATAPLPTDAALAGGLVRVGVWSEPDPELGTFGGQAVRALTRPSLFEVQPDGSWTPSLAESGSVTVAGDRTAVSFRLVDGAAWSNGSLIGAADLRRTADQRFVAGVDGPDPDGLLTVRFTQPLVDWERLWSGPDAIAPPAADVWGGPFRVAGRVPGLETVLVPNEVWWGGTRPALDEVRFVLVGDQITAFELLERGELDVLAPLAVTSLARGLDDLDGVEWATAPRSGWWFGLWANPDELRVDQRRGLQATVERTGFVDVLLAEEAELLDSFIGAGTWAGDPDDDVAALRTRSETIVTGYDEIPMAPLLQRSMQMRARDVGATLTLRNARADLVAGWLAADDYQAALQLVLDPPTPCWTCRFEGVDAGLARAADGGDRAAARALEARLRDEAILLPLWRPEVVVVWRERVQGVEPNGFVPAPSWNADEWTVEP